MKARLHVTKSGERISIINRHFFLEAVEKEETEYAFYVEYKSHIEKRWYRKNISYKSEIEIEKGLYHISFFYRKDDVTEIQKYSFFYSDERGLVYVNKSLIKETIDYKVELYDVKAPISFIVFNAAGSHKKSRPFGLHYLLSQGYNVVVCYQDADNFYQSLSLDQFESLVKPLVVATEVYLYGSSLGGYCSLYYAGAVNGTVIAAAPRNPLHPILQELEKTKIEKLYIHDEITNVPLTSKEVYVLIDPKVRKDVIFFEKCVKPAYPNLILLEVPYSGHAVLYHLIKTRQLSNILENIVNNKEVKINDIESEFIIYGKTLEAYRVLMQNIKKLESYNNLHPLVQKQVSQLQDRLRK